MIEDVRDQFVRMLQSEPWMDRASSTVAVEKVNIIHNDNISIIYPLFSLNIFLLLLFEFGGVL